MTYVYRLTFTPPPEPPEDWFQIIYGYEYNPSADPDDRDPEFSWPERRLYLSASGAAKRKKLLERLGATVAIERSNVVTFPLGRKAGDSPS